MRMSVTLYIGVETSVVVMVVVRCKLETQES
jgi:hypothetical protein